MNEQEFIKLIEEKMDAFYHFALRMCHNREDAEDIVQEAMLKLWKNRDRMNKKQNVMSYIFTTIKNVYLDKEKSKKSKKKLYDSISYRIEKRVEFDKKDFRVLVDEDRFAYKIDMSDEVNIIDSIINTLPENMKMVVQFRDIEGYSTKETAELLNMNIASVKMSLSRARKLIRQTLIKNYKINYGNR